MKILLHQCCAPCSIYPTDRLLSDGHDVHGWFYNPNIHPYTEYMKRLDTLRDYNNKINIPFTVIDIYGLRGFIKMAESAEGDNARCEGCYRSRLEKAAEFAVINNFDAFTSTLLYSRRQKHDIIRRVAEEASKSYGIGFWYEDYRKGWQIGIDISKKEGIYRQNYCGCIYSEEERFSRK